MTRKTNPKREIREKTRTRGGRPDYKTIVIVCEGSKTEKLYFENYKERHSGLRIEIPNADKFTDPVNLVSFAIKCIRKFNLGLQEGDSVWCICDVDQIDDGQLAKAKLLADDNGIGFALSNPSFELWYLLHYKYTTANLTNDHLLKELSKEISGYQKNENIFHSIKDQTDDAITRSLRLNKYHTDESRDLFTRASNPSTQVYKLVKHIQDIKRANGVIS